MKNERLQAIFYVLADGFSAAVAYVVLYTFRKTSIEKITYDPGFYSDNRFVYGLVATVLFCLATYYVGGHYKDVFRRSRLKELFQTFNATLFAAVVAFFLIILDDWVNTYKEYYQSFFVFFGCLFLLTQTLRFLITTRTNNRIQSRIIWFNTLLIGSNHNALELYRELENQKRSTGNKFIGFVPVYDQMDFLIENDIPRLGNYKELPSTIRQYQIEEVIIAIESSEHNKLESIINLLEGTGVRIKMIPDTYDIISGQVRLESLGAPLVEIKHELMPFSQKVAKRAIDVLASLFVLTVLSPLYVFTAIMVKMSSPGPVLYRQERIGLHGKPFKILKFRSMVVDAEREGPQLSSKEDDRITRWGRVMRKYRLDELPQFINVFIGEMSLVGPRPERQFYIDKIIEAAPHYKHLHKVKPGITSWGMVKFGYAENVEEMVQRLKYDIIYIENMSILNDIKILFYTVLIVLQGRGK